MNKARNLHKDWLPLTVYLSLSCCEEQDKSSDVEQQLWNRRPWQIPRSRAYTQIFCHGFCKLHEHEHEAKQSHTDKNFQIETCVDAFIS